MVFTLSNKKEMARVCEKHQNISSLNMNKPFTFAVGPLVLQDNF